ncbi:MAG TPA: hypothetical protein VKX28_29385 [Xanthobacteraceae bacterium]|jgi:hypothetical protein|nr:hypothetical protein [Xanthobacteraceae bacterium]
MKPILEEQIAELARELALRRAVYPRLIAAGRLRRTVAQENLARLRAALRTLRGMRRKRGGAAPPRRATRGRR